MPKIPLQSPVTPVSGENLPAGKTTPGLMPASHQAAGEPENTDVSPAGPGKPVDGSPAVNTYTPRDVQAQEFAAGAQDWPKLTATELAQVDLPEGTPAPNPTLTEPPPPPEAHPESNPAMADQHEPMASERPATGAPAAAVEPRTSV